MPKYAIEARSLDIANVASHNFLVLRDENGRALAELHGLATDRKSGKFEPIGTDEARHTLRVWHFPHDPAYAASLGVAPQQTTFIRGFQNNVTLLVADKAEVLDRWKSAVDARTVLNALDLNYPNYGFNLGSDTINSNASFRTLSEIMGLPVHDFAGSLQPGLANRMVSAEVIAAMRNGAYPVLNRSSVESDGKYRPLDTFLHGDQVDHQRTPAQSVKPDAEEVPREPQERRSLKLSIDQSPAWQMQNLLLDQIRAGVARIDASLGRTPDASSERMTASLYALAKEAGMTGVDHVVLGRAGTRAAEGEYVFLVKGDPATSIYQREQMKTADAVAAPVEQSLARAQEIGRDQSREMVDSRRQQEMETSAPSLRV